MDLQDAFDRAAPIMEDQRGRYFWEPIPSPLDGPLNELVQAFVQADTPARREFISQLTRRQRSLISSFGVRLASITVRESDPDLLVLGLVALWLGWPGVEDIRERIMDMAPMYAAAVKLEADPRTLFDRAANVVGDDVFRGFLRAFLSRPEEKKSLSALGYREVTGPDGFRFEPGGLGW